MIALMKNDWLSNNKLTRSKHQTCQRYTLQRDSLRKFWNDDIIAPSESFHVDLELSHVYSCKILSCSKTQNAFSIIHLWDIFNEGF